MNTAITRTLRTALRTLYHLLYHRCLHRHITWPHYDLQRCLDCGRYRKAFISHDAWVFGFWTRDLTIQSAVQIANSRHTPCQQDNSRGTLGK